MSRRHVPLWHRHVLHQPTVDGPAALNLLSKMATLVLGVLCVLPGLSVVTSTSRAVADATSAMPGELPTTFMNPSTLTKLQNIMCKSCSFRPRICRDMSPSDVCHLLCGCSNYNRKCLLDGQCTCPLSHEGECPRGSEAVCEFDDALVCSTSNDVCLYYDEIKVHCDCRHGWSGEGCQTCNDEVVDCQVDTKSGEPSGAGPDFPLKALVVGCTVCVLMGVVLGVVICLCRGGKLVWITGSWRMDNDEKQEQRTDAPEPPAARRQYYNTAQYAVPDKPSSPIRQTTFNAAYAEPNTPFREQKHDNYYYKLEPSSGIVTYESVSHRVEDRSLLSHSGRRENPSPCDVMTGNQAIDKGSGTRASASKTRQSCDMYDHLQRNVGITGSDVTNNYSHIELQSAH